MRNVSQQYPVLNTDLMYLDPNEQYLAPAEVSKTFIAGFAFQGTCVYTSVRDGHDDVWLPNDGGYFQLTAEEHLYPMLCTASDSGFSWLCISTKADGQYDQYETQPVTVAGDYTLPAGWGFVVVQGRVTTEGKTATQGLYFSPRTTDVIVSGDAILIILR
jgi:hypothetical protein